MESSLFVLYLFFLARVYTSAFDEITCSPPVAKENIIVDGLPDNDDLLRYGHQLQFTCKSGFKLVGQKDVTCGENGVWNHPSPICEANKDCVAPPYVEFADITTLQKSHYSSGESVKYMCQNLYTLSGQSYKTCTHGMWSGLMKCLIIITFIILQGQTKSQATTESTQASSAELTSTYSSTTSPSTVSSTSALSKAHPTSSTSLATSINQTATSSQPHTASPVKITTTVQTSTGSAMKNSSETTAFGSKALVSLTTILSSTKEPRSTAASTGTVNAISHSEITTTDQTYKASAVTNISQTTDLWSKALVSLTTILSSAKEPKSTAASTGEVSANSASGNEKNDNLVMNPGLVAILCIFFIVLALVLVVAIAKIISYRRNSQFERLEDLPMSQQSKKNENAPFARYPPK